LSHLRESSTKGRKGQGRREQAAAPVQSVQKVQMLVSQAGVDTCRKEDLLVHMLKPSKTKLSLAELLNTFCAAVYVQLGKRFLSTGHIAGNMEGGEGKSGVKMVCLFTCIPHHEPRKN